MPEQRDRAKTSPAAIAAIFVVPPILFLVAVLLWRGCAQAPPPSAHASGAEPDGQAPAPRAPVSPDARTGTLRLRFLDVPGGAAQTVSYAIYASQVQDAPVESDYRDTVETKLAAGTYDVLCQTRATEKWARGIQVRADETTEQTIFLGNGTLHLTFLDAQDGQPVNTSYAIYAQGDRDTKLDSDHQRETTVDLLDGTYDILCQWPTGRKWVEDVRVTAGEQTDAGIALDLGRLHFQVYREGDLMNVSYQIYPTGRHDEALADDFGKDRVLLLAAGRYDLHCEWDGGETWVREIAIAPGQTVKQVVTIEE